jgi:primosomal protein N' (replication factor Y)
LKIAEVAFPVPLPKGFHYRIPEGLSVSPGQRVWAPFGPRRMVGTILSVFDGEPTRPLKLIDRTVDSTSALSSEAIACAHWMARRFGASIGECVKALLPPYVKSLTEPSPVSAATGPRAAVHFELTESQSKALLRLEELLDAKRWAQVVLFGVPASGKTEVYMRLITRAVAQGGQALFLLPEIALTRPFFNEFSAGLGVPVALWHSGLTLRERRLTWLAVQRGDIRVVVGARSACLLPFKDLRLAVLDEEQDESFKQDGAAPFYHARELVLERAKSFGSLVVMGSATPSIEAWDMARRGDAELLSMPDRVSRIEKPTIRVVAMPGFGEVLSNDLVHAIRERMHKGEQVILLVNRRGFSTLTMCHKCRWIDRCTDCGVAKISHESSIGVFLGSGIWWIILTFITEKLSHKIKDVYIDLVNKVFSIFIVIIGSILLLSVLFRYVDII